MATEAEWGRTCYEHAYRNTSSNSTLPWSSKRNSSQSTLLSQNPINNIARNLQMCWSGTRLGDWSIWPIHVLTEPNRPSHVFSSILVPLPLEYQDDLGSATICNNHKHMQAARGHSLEVKRGHTEPEHERPSGEMTTLSQVQSHSILGSTRHKLCSSQDSSKLCFPRMLSAIMTIMVNISFGSP